jgi:putative redox protein
MQSITKLVADDIFETEMNGIKVRLDTGSDNKINLSPVENLLPSIASCSAIDVVEIIKKKRKQVGGLEIITNATRREQPIPKIITEFHLTFVLTSADATDKDLQQAVTLSMDKYCTISKMLGGVADISYDWKILRD